MKVLMLVVFRLLAGWSTWNVFGSALAEEAPKEDIVPLQKGFPQKCYDHLGCFETGYPFYDPPHRSLSLVPFGVIHTKFMFFSPKLPKVMQVVNYTSSGLNLTVFDGSLPTKVFIHGFSVGLLPNFTDMLWSMFLGNGQQNLTVLDWTSSNGAPYAQAVANARVVAAQLAHLLRHLKEKNGLKPRDVHLIGHSLGAHLAGHTGKKFTDLGRITGLDPAGPGFYDSDSRVRLDSSDADFVDVIYTNSGHNFVEGLALDVNVGYLNFYPNGGSIQPGCYNNSAPPKAFDAARNSCSHARALYLFLSSVRLCQFWGVPCDTAEQLRTCRMRSRVQRNRHRMGMHATKPTTDMKNQKLYLSTTETFPFCVQHARTR